MLPRGALHLFFGFMVPNVLTDLGPLASCHTSCHNQPLGVPLSIEPQSSHKIVVFEPCIGHASSSTYAVVEEVLILELPHSGGAYLAPVVSRVGMLGSAKNVG